MRFLKNLLVHISKKQKISGAYSDQSIEQLNDVTAVSGVNLRVCILFLSRHVFQENQLISSLLIWSSRKRKNNYFLGPKRIVEFQKLLERLFKKKKKD